MPPGEAVDLLRSESGRFLDPRVVLAISAVVDEWEERRQARAGPAGVQAAGPELAQSERIAGGLACNARASALIVILIVMLASVVLAGVASTIALARASNGG